MKKFVLIPDSFKGTMSSAQICNIMEKSIKSEFEKANIIKIPVADGGEGTVDAFLAALGGEKMHVSVSGPFGETVDGFYAVIGKTAVVEMAAAAGLPLAENALNPEAASTYGVGELIKHALGHNIDKLIIGLGGSATNDGGCGAAAALGVKFYNNNNCEFIPVGGTLCDITRIDTSNTDTRLKQAEVVIMCDIDNPLYGKNGAAYIFAPQKGADRDMVERLDNGLVNLANVVKQCLGTDIEAIDGAGAAGGMGGGFVAFFNAKMQMGIEAVLDTVNFDKLIRDADIVFTGEGRIDGQSLRGKVVIGVARRAKAQNVPVVAIVGDISDGAQAAYELGVSGIFSINRVAVPYSEAKIRAEDDLRLTMDNLMKFTKSVIKSCK